jgi:leucyl/phenylalanyl-tRNA--protein transferase
MIPWLDDTLQFPPVTRALREPNGLLAAGGDLSTARLLAAYRQGVFPWYSSGEPILWWSPDPRTVLWPRAIAISHSLRKTLRKHDFEIRLDSAFEDVVRACSMPRRPGAGTWITDEMQAAYLNLHQQGHAHSIETWRHGKLIGGLYGVALGRAFFGESMFSRENDASKIALVHLARYLERRGFAVIDCQMTTDHLRSMGATEIPREEFCQGVAQWTAEGGPPGKWPIDDCAQIFATVKNDTA